MLGGVIDGEISVKRGEISLDEAAERIIAAVELYHRYPTVRIVFSGGNAVFGGPPKSEFAIRFLKNLDLPHDRIELDSRSRNTRENAVNTMQLVRPKPGERWLLITSAYHMPRAIGLFRQAGFPVEAYPVDWQTGGWGRPLGDVIFFFGRASPFESGGS